MGQPPAQSAAQRDARVFRTAKWVRVLSTFAMLLIVSCGIYYIVNHGTLWPRLGGAALVAFGVAGFIDTLVSRIVLDDDAIHVISLVRTRSYPRADLQSAKVSGGAVVLEKREGGWLVLPDTGANALGVRNTIDAWIKRQGSGIGDQGEKERPED